MIYLYKHSTDKIDVTKYYLGTILDAISDTYQIIENPDLLKSGDIVITSNMIDAYKLLRTGKNVKIINWYQGIIPEEISCQSNEFIRLRIEQHLNKIFKLNSSVCKAISLAADFLYRSGIISKVLSIFEKKVLNRSFINIFVSEAMHKHYQKKYSYSKRNFFIMPCFNTLINKECFLSEMKYEKPNFAYIGGLDKWQCFDKILKIFKQVESLKPNAKLFVYTPLVDEAISLARKETIKNIEVASFSGDELTNRLRGIKYGFLIRDNINVNNVATPTKMGNYVGCGIIPIFTDTIEDFKMVFQSINYKVSLDSKLDQTSMAKKIIQFEDCGDFSWNKIYDEYCHIFDTYYNRDNYIIKFREFFNEQISNLK